MRCWRDMLPQQASDRTSRYFVEHSGTNAPATLHQRDNRGFVAGISATVTTSTATNPSFVSFDHALELVSRREVFQSKANPMAEKPRAAIRTKLKMALQL